MTISRTLWTQFFGAGRYVSILTGLLTFGYLGHQTHWTFVRQAHGESAQHGAGSEKPADKHADLKPVARGATVEFPTKESVTKTGITSGSVERRTLQDRINAMGVITYDQRLTAQLSSRASGTVWRSTKQPGDTVKKGDVLLIIDAVDVGRVKTEFLSNLVDVESKTEILANVEKNKAIGVISDRLVREARIALRESKIQLLNSEQTLINFGLSVKSSEFTALDDAARSAKLHFLGLPADLVAELDPSSTTSNLLPLTAPFDGAMIGHEAVLGESVEAGKPILELANVGRMWVKLNVPKEDGSKLVLGQPISFLPDGMTEAVHSKISWISTAVDEQTRTLQIRADVENPKVSEDPQTHREVHLLRANAYGTGTIMVREALDVVSVPESAVTQTENGPLIFVQTGERSFRRCEVKLGIHDGDFIQVLSGGIEPGQQVVTQGSHALKSELILNQLASAGS